MLYNRILLKLSGEMLTNKNNEFDYKKIKTICKQIKKIKDQGVEISIVIGGGNYWRGRENTNIEKDTSDYIGMLATVMNGMAFNDVLNQVGCSSVVVSSLRVNDVVEAYNKNKVSKYLKDNVVVLAGGTGHPNCSTDTAAAEKAIDTKTDLIIKMTKVDGVYDKDPIKYKNAIKYDNLSYDEVLKNKLEVMDLESIEMCKKNNIDIIVTNMDFSKLKKILKNKVFGTKISGDKNEKNTK